MNPAGVGQVAASSLPIPPAPLVGSPRYFALLYTPPALRATLTTLLALADEISAGAGCGLDHSVAHARLEWWRLEAERYARGEPLHPWLRASLSWPAAAVRLNLQPLVEAAASDLATETLSARPGAALQGAVFRLAATALRAGRDVDTASPVLAQLLDDLGQRARELERFAGRGMQPQSALTAATASGTPAATLKALRQQVERIERALQPPLVPLLVWIALAARQARRSARSAGGKSGSGLAPFADNIAAWNAARRALRGRFRID